MKFKVLRGSHTEGGQRYGKGSVVASASDLSKHNYPGAIKFEKLAGGTELTEEEPTPTSQEEVLDDETYTRDELTSMTKAALTELAEELEIDLEGVTKKDDIISEILGE